MAFSLPSHYRPCPTCAFPMGRTTTTHSCLVRSAAVREQWHLSWTKPYDEKLYRRFFKEYEETMPKFSAMGEGALASTYAFSAVDIKTLGASEYTLVGIEADCSGSVSGFARDIEAALKAVNEACRKSPRADNLMVRYGIFETGLQEVHGFKLLQDCHPADYDNSIPAGGMTALYDACVDGIDALARYGRELQNNDFSANGILFVITDGLNNTGKMTVTEVKKALDRVVPSEALESIVTILIGVNLTDPAVAKALAEFSAQVGFTQFVDIGAAEPKNLAKLAAFVSKSISSQSQALGTGSGSKALTF